MSILSDVLWEWWPLPAALGIVYLVFHRDGLTEQSLYAFEVKTAVGHAFNGTVEKKKMDSISNVRSTEYNGKHRGFW